MLAYLPTAASRSAWLPRSATFPLTAPGSHPPLRGRWDGGGSGW